MKRNFWLGYSIAPLTGPLLYGVFILFIPGITDNKEFGAEAWLLSMSLFALFSYLISLFIGVPILILLKKYNKLSFWFASSIFSVFYTLFIYLILFVVLQPLVTGNIYLISMNALLVSGALGFIIITVYLKIAGITSQPSTPAQNAGGHLLRRKANKSNGEKNGFL